MGPNMTVELPLLQHVRNVIRTTTITSAATGAAVTALCKVETNHAEAGLNAVSHILWGDKAATVNAWETRHTLTGGAWNTAAMTAWAVVHETGVSCRSTRATF